MTKGSKRKAKRKFPKTMIRRALAMKVLTLWGTDTITGKPVFRGPHAHNEWPVDGTWVRAKRKRLVWCQNGVHAASSVRYGLSNWYTNANQRLFIIDLRNVRRSAPGHISKVVAERGRIVAGPLERDSQDGASWYPAFHRAFRALTNHRAFAKHVVLE